MGKVWNSIGIGPKVVMTIMVVFASLLAGGSLSARSAIAFGS